MATIQNQQAHAQRADHESRLMVGGVAALGIVALTALAFLGGQSSFEPTPSGAETAHATPVEPAAPQVSVVRIDAGGNAIISGRAAPGAVVTFRTDGKVIGSIGADANGVFTFVTGRPLDPGQQEITFSSRLADNAEQAPAHGIMVDVPAMPNEGPLGMLTGNNLGVSRLFGGKPDQTERGGTLTIGSVDYSGTGSATITGTAPPRSEVELYQGQIALGETFAGGSGRWKMHVRVMPRQSGQFQLKALHPSGAALARTADLTPDIRSADAAKRL